MLDIKPGGNSYSSDLDKFASYHFISRETTKRGPETRESASSFTVKLEEDNTVPTF